MNPATSNCPDPAQEPDHELRPKQPGWLYTRGQCVRKKSGSEWYGTIVGFYSTTLTPRGYCVESMHHKGSVQIYPESALELVK